MLYVITYTRNGKTETYQATLPEVRALAEYVKRTYRINADIRRAA